jgi:LysR family transcriptional regulator, cyn operon transcriptional activator
MELNHLRSFYEVAKSGSFTEAARRLRLSQSALSKAVGLLEGREGVTLLERSKKGVKLTPLGSEIFLKCERIFQTVDEIEQQCQGKKESCDGPLRLGGSDHVAHYLLVDELQRLRKQHPGIVPFLFTGVPSDTVEMILKGEIELGFFFTKVTTPLIDYELLVNVKMTVVCHPAILADAKGKPATWLKHALNKAGYITSIGSLYQHHPSQEFLDALEQSPHPVFECSSQETQKRACLAGGGVAWLARFMVEKEIASGELKEIPLAKPISLGLYAAARRGRDLSLGARTFLAGLRKNLRARG